MPDSGDATPETLRQMIDELRTIQMVAGQCSVEGPENEQALMAAAEAERCRKWADTLEPIVERAARAVALVARLAQEDLDQVADVCRAELLEQYHEEARRLLDGRTQDEPKTLES